MGEGTGRLIVDCLGGRLDAREPLLARLRARLVLWVAARMSPDLRSRLEPEDLVQDTLTAVHEGLDGFRGADPHAFLAWVFRLAENRIRDAARHFARAKRQEAPIPHREVTTPSAAAARADEIEWVRNAIAALPVEERLVIRLVRLEDLGYPAVAEALGVTEGAARVRFCRAMKALGRALRRQRAGGLGGST